MKKRVPAKQIFWTIKDIRRTLKLDKKTTKDKKVHSFLEVIFGERIANLKSVGCNKSIYNVLERTIVRLA